MLVSVAEPADPWAKPWRLSGAGTDGPCEVELGAACDGAPEVGCAGDIAEGILDLQGENGCVTTVAANVGVVRRIERRVSV